MIVEIEKNLRRSKIVPRRPNTKAAGIEIYIINLTKVLTVLPHPGLNRSDIALAIKIPVRSNVIAIFPKRIFNTLGNELINCLILTISKN